MTKTALFSRKNPGGVFSIESQDISTGDRFYVDSGSATTSTSGDNPDRPFATIDEAINKATANNGDIIYVMPGHSETISGATELVPDKAGLLIKGLGFGADRPKLDFDNTAGQVLVSGANTRFENFVFECSVDSLVAAIQITGSNVTLFNCEFSAPTTAENPLIWVLSTAAANHIHLIDCYTSGLGNTEAGPASVVSLVGADDLVITGCNFFGNYSVAAISNPTTAADRVTIRDNQISNLNTTADLMIDLQADTTGHIHGNVGRCGDATPATGAIDPGNCTQSENYAANLDAETGALCGVVST